MRRPVCVLSLFLPCLFLSAWKATGDGAEPSAPGKPWLEKTDLFEAGKGDHALYRIPGIVVTPKGTVLTWCEARRTARSDWGTIDVFLRRSTDGGRTWEAPRKIVTPPADARKNPVALKQKLAKEGEITVNNPVAVVDRKSGIVHFLYCVEYARCFSMSSKDEGKTFSAPVEITPTFEAFRKDYDWKVLATGPGHGIQLRNGRLVVPVWLSLGTGGHAHRPSAVSVIVSDDHGRTWKRGDIVCAHPDPINPSETVVAELADGQVMLNIRHEGKQGRRAVTLSRDGATGWSRLRYDPALPEPVCMGALARLSARPGSDRNRLLFVNPHNPVNRERKNLTVKLSYDEGETWPVARTLEAGASGYSDLAVGPDGTIYCFYERGTTERPTLRPRSLCLARFNLEWLTEGKDRLTGGK